MMQRLLSVFIFSLVVTGAAVAMPTQASAISTPTAIVAADCRGGVESFLGLRSWDSCLTLGDNGKPQIVGLNDVWLIILVVVEDFIKVAAYVAAGFVVWGGIKYLKSQGDPGETTQARQIIHNALFGLLITLISIAIVTTVARTF